MILSARRHSFEQDCILLKALHPQKLKYLGILGPMHRTNHVLFTTPQELTNKDGEWLERLHAPVGLPIGSGDAATIALSIVAEIQSELHGKQVMVLDKRQRAGNKLPEKNTIVGLPSLPS
jgi:xanthine/CO dehydrogenase XdhC/CoxF family maturation factor